MSTAATLPRPLPAASARPADSRRSLWNILYRGITGMSAFTAGHEIGHFVIASEVAHRMVREGVSGQVLIPLGELLGLPTTQLAPVLGVDRATARRYIRDNQALPTHSAETVLRLAELEALALDVFASEEAAHGWLKQRHSLLGESPIDAASTSYGAQRVREILTAIKYGGVA